MRSPPSLNCRSNLALVSWAEDPDAVRVRVNATSVLGHTATCSSSANNCSLTALLCGQTYSVYGTAQGPRCESTPSAPFSIITGKYTTYSSFSTDFFLQLHSQLVINSGRSYQNSWNRYSTFKFCIIFRRKKKRCSAWKCLLVLMMEQMSTQSFLFKFSA